jgi:transcriptional regulator with GAF, ATPase, and Fis domain
MRTDLFQKNIIILLTIFVFFVICSSQFLFWNESIQDGVIDVQFKLRGTRTVSDNIVFIFIGDEDIQALGDWPITRDYYGYLVHILKEMEVRTIGIDVLFSKEDTRHPEYDRMLVDFINSAGNICLPFSFSELTPPPKEAETDLETLLIGQNKTLPQKIFRNNCAGLGFSNFERQSVLRKIPLAVSANDTIFFSFGLELARLYLGIQNSPQLKPDAMILPRVDGLDIHLPMDSQARYRLNHFGDISNIKTVSVLDLFQTFEKDSDLLDLKNKLVIAAFTATGIANLKSTPLSAALPASLIHITVAENCIEQNFLSELAIGWRWFVIFLAIFFAFVIGYIIPLYRRLAIAVGIAILYVFIGMILFTSANLIIPLFYPLLAYISTFAYLGVVKRQQQAQLDASLKNLLNEQMRTKEEKLEEAREKLAAIEKQLEKETTMTDQNRRLADERKATIRRVEKELEDLKTYAIPATITSKIDFTEIIHAETSRLKSVLELVQKIGSNDIPVLIMGETGTGKEMIARAIHQTSNRKNAPFIAVNCGALSETLLESELFGHEKGSFTGALTRRRGRFEIANGGTIFLDEITETSPAFQARLLRVLQDKNFERLGGEETIKTDVRVIAATNKNLTEEMENNRFRSDLFRLNGFPITLPGLNERVEDIPLLAKHFLEKHNFKDISGLSERAMQLLQSYVWPGNVRELENSIRRAAILARSEGRNLIKKSDLPEEMSRTDSIQDLQTVHKPLEKQILEMMQTLKFSHNAVSQTARALGNKDRGTITEYLRGICFEHTVNANFNVEEAAQLIAATKEVAVVEKVQAKINEYISNLQPLAATSQHFKNGNLPPAYKGLPRKYHIYLKKLLEHLANK